jgi:hypothetical protein
MEKNNFSSAKIQNANFQYLVVITKFCKNDVIIKTKESTQQT